MYKVLSDFSGSRVEEPWTSPGPDSPLSVRVHSVIPETEVSLAIHTETWPQKRQVSNSKIH